MQEEQDNIKERTQSEHENNTHPSPILHTQHSNTKRKRTAQHKGMQCKGDRTMQGAGSNSKTGNTAKGARTTQDRGTTHTHHTPPFNKTTIQQQGGTPILNGRDNATAPALPSLCHPPPQRHPTIHDGPTHHHDEGVAHRGYPTTRTAQTHTHHPHTTHLASNSTRHNSSTRQHYNGMNRARAAPLHRAGQQQYTPPPFHTPRRMDTIHPSTHPLQLIRVHTTDDQR